jgi:hypothetical protein
MNTFLCVVNYEYKPSVYEHAYRCALTDMQPSVYEHAYRCALTDMQPSVYEHALSTDVRALRAACDDMLQIMYWSHNIFDCVRIICL